MDSMKTIVGFLSVMAAFGFAGCCGEVVYYEPAPRRVYVIPTPPTHYHHHYHHHHHHSTPQPFPHPYLRTIGE